jgi:hypothetical protein
MARDDRVVISPDLGVSFSNRGRFKPLAWAIFLGTSWTWCIGMYLPVLLLRDLGIGGFLVFAIPNVLGAAAMGWIMRSMGQSRLFIAVHWFAAAMFSIVTIAFHVFFIIWIVRPLAGIWTWPAIAGAITVFAILLSRRNAGAWLAAILAFAVSVAAIIWSVRISAVPKIVPRSPTGLPLIDIAFLAPVCVFGFALCPYLDLTFHRARQALDRTQARFAFVLGFGVVFLLMLLFTAGYSRWLTGPIGGVIAVILAIHFIAQCGFTMAVHGQSVLISGGLRLPLAIILVVAIAIAAALGFAGGNSGESIYRFFMGFYGLVFPTYVWLCMIPPRRSAARAVIAILVAAPMFWMGFIEREMIWLIPGVAVPLLAKIARSATPQATAVSKSSV